MLAARTHSSHLQQKVADLEEARLQNETLKQDILDKDTEIL
jgi:hypothetical protein